MVNIEHYTIRTSDVFESAKGVRCNKFHYSSCVLFRSLFMLRNSPMICDFLSRAINEKNEHEIRLGLEGKRFG